MRREESQVNECLFDGDSGDMVIGRDGERERVDMEKRDRERMYTYMGRGDRQVGGYTTSGKPV